MYRSVSLVLLGVATAALAAATPAHALTFDEVNVRIPFAFHVQDETLPAGAYVIEQPDAYYQDVLLLRSEDGRHSVMVPVEEATPSPRDQYKDRLVFSTYKDAKFLLALQLGDFGEAKVLPATSEIRLSWQRASTSSGQPRQMASTTR